LHMNRILLIALSTLALVSAQDICQLYLISTLPALQPLYTNYKSGNWTAFERGLESFIGSAQLVAENCLESKLLSSTGTQQCLKDTYVVARLIAPLGVQLNDSVALTNLVNNFNTAITSAYRSCVKGDENFLALYELDSDSAYTELSRRQFSVNSTLKDFFGCLNDLYAITPLLISFVQDVRAQQSYDVISNDLKVIFANANQLCDDCGIPKPSGGGGPVDIQKCLLTASQLSDDVYAILNGSIIEAAQGLYAFITDAPQTLTDCGITA
jgi:hypothetical protein